MFRLRTRVQLIAPYKCTEHHFATEAVRHSTHEQIGFSETEGNPFMVKEPSSRSPSRRSPLLSRLPGFRRAQRDRGFEGQT